MAERKKLIAMAACAGLAISAAARAQVNIVNNISGTFNDVSGSGSPIATGDDVAGQTSVSAAVANAAFPAGTLNACTNGHAGYGGASTAYFNEGATGLPYPWTGYTYPVAAVYFDDLITHVTGAGVYAQEVTENGHQVLVVEWVRMDHYFSSPGTATFEMKVYGAGNGPMNAYAQYIYQTTAFGDGNDNGASATVGYQYNASAAETYSYDTAGSIPEGLVLSLVQGVTGACCLPNGTCAVLSSNNCSNSGGIYRGDNSPCSTANCPNGACCLPDGTCVMTASGGCASQNGVYRGDGTSCSNGCPQGACCTAAGCVLYTEIQCTTQNGTYHGDHSTCAQAGCPQAWQEQGDAGDLPATAQFCVGTGPLPGITGSNDVADTDMYAITISDAGSFLATTTGTGTTWDTMLFLFDATGHGIAANDDAPYPTSTLTSQFVPGNGLYYLAITHFFRVPQDSGGQTLWNSYTPEMRPDGPGAANAVAGWNGASGGGGAYTIALSGTSFVNSSTVGACCLSDGSCTLNTSGGCTGSGGIYRGNGSNCGTANCPQPPSGACCTESGCFIRTQAQCAAANGTYRGDNVTCAAANCPAPTLWAEQGDAGDLPATAQIASGPAGTPLMAITGTLTAGNADMFEIQICDPGSFAADTANTATTISDTQLFLFDSTGHGVSFDDDDPQGTGGLHSRLSSQFIPGPGLYYIAISPYDQDPRGADTGGEIWADTPFNVERRPDGPAASEAIGSWDTGSSSSGAYRITLAGACFVSTGPTCYANCDHSTLIPFLNVNDFLCFQTKFAAGDSYANCDNSTIPPVLNVNDFLCFQTKFAAGCSAP